MIGKIVTAMSAEDLAKRDADRGFSDADLAEVMDSPEWTDEQLRQAQLFEEVFPDLAASMKRDRKAEKI